jgi:aerobic carbon-monoxide dehydrogenase medium subunit
MKAARFDYLRPGDLQQAVAALAQAKTNAGGAKLLAGGQSLGPMLNLRLARPALVVDVSRLESLARIEDIGRAWRIGACVTHSRIEDMREQLAGGEMLREVAAGIAYRAIRNRGTIGGSIAHADPAADWPLALAALGATVNIRSAGGARAISLEKFMLGAFTTALREDEIIESVDVPKLSRAGRYGYYKFCRRTGDFAEASAAAVFDPETQAARIYFGAVCPAPVALPALARRIAQEGRSAVSEQAAGAAIAEVASHLRPVERRMVTAAVTRALQQVFAS